MSQILGLAPAAQVVVLQGLSTYAALASAYFFARPVLRGQTLTANREVLANLAPRDAGLERLVRTATALLDQRAIEDQPGIRRDNRIGWVLLVLSFVFFTAAVLRQVETDPLFRGGVQSGEPCAGAQTKVP